MENALPPVKTIRQDAIIKLNIGTGMIERLQEVLAYFAKQVSPEQIDNYTKEVADYEKIASKEKEFTEDWMVPVTTISFFLGEIEKEADLQGLTSEINLEDYVKSKISEAQVIADTIEEDDSLPDQSQLQPE